MVMVSFLPYLNLISIAARIAVAGHGQIGRNTKLVDGCLIRAKQPIVPDSRIKGKGSVLLLASSPRIGCGISLNSLADPSFDWYNVRGGQGNEDSTLVSFGILEM
jgi:hypothetical protein